MNCYVTEPVVPAKDGTGSTGLWILSGTPHSRALAHCKPSMFPVEKPAALAPKAGVQTLALFGCYHSASQAVWHMPRSRPRHIQGHPSRDERRWRPTLVGVSKHRSSHSALKASTICTTQITSSTTAHRELYWRVLWVTAKRKLSLGQHPHSVHRRWTARLFPESSSLWAGIANTHVQY